jgi:hypothetical protein
MLRCMKHLQAQLLELAAAHTHMQQQAEALQHSGSAGLYGRDGGGGGGGRAGAVGEDPR